MFAKLILHENCRSELENYLARPFHALILTGVIGVGLHSIAVASARKIANANQIDLQPTIHKGQKTAIISADDISYLIKIIYDKRSAPLAVIIDDIDQAASGVSERLLKLIEEPVTNVYYIFTTHHLAKLPATILSRSASIEVQAPPVKACAQLMNDLKIAPQIQAQIKFLAPNLPAEICRLATNPAHFADQVKFVKLAKQFLATTDIAARIKLTTDLKTRVEADKFCTVLMRLLIYVCRTHTNPQYFKNQVTTINSTVNNLNQNANVRLALLNLCLQFS